MKTAAVHSCITRGRGSATDGTVKSQVIVVKLESGPRQCGTRIEAGALAEGLTTRAHQWNHRAAKGPKIDATENSDLSALAGSKTPGSGTSNGSPHQIAAVKLGAANGGKFFQTTWRSERTAVRIHPA